MKAFECKKCGECCYGEGGIHLQSEEIDKIADFLGLTAESFIDLYCEQRHGRLYIRSASSGYCTFFDPDQLCLIHPVKPRPCARWPFYPALVKDRAVWNYAKEGCPGINPDASFEDFVKESKKRVLSLRNRVRHSRVGGSPEDIRQTGFPPSRE